MNHKVSKQLRVQDSPDTSYYSNPGSGVFQTINVLLSHQVSALASEAFLLALWKNSLSRTEGYGLESVVLSLPRSYILELVWLVAALVSLLSFSLLYKIWSLSNYCYQRHPVSTVLSLLVIGLEKRQFDKQSDQRPRASSIWQTDW
jgi:hypothetical protein